MHKPRIAIIAAWLLIVSIIVCSTSFAKDQDQALIEAAQKGDLKQVQRFLYVGAYVNAHDHAFHWTALMEACGGGHLDVVKLLIANGADVNDVGDVCGGKRGGTALMIAVWTGQADIVKFLLEKGADVNETEIIGVTALGVALLRNNKQIVELLKACGAEGLGLGYHKNRSNIITRSPQSPNSLKQVQALLAQGAMPCAEVPYR